MLHAKNEGFSKYTIEGGRSYEIQYNLTNAVIGYMDSHFGIIFLLVDTNKRRKETTCRY